MSGTDIAYGGNSLRVPYAMSGTDLSGNGITRSLQSTTVCTLPCSFATLACRALLIVPTMAVHGTDLARATTTAVRGPARCGTALSPTMAARVELIFYSDWLRSNNEEGVQRAVT
eukprot:1100595-Rhodomonas_salina.5